MKMKKFAFFFRYANSTSICVFNVLRAQMKSEAASSETDKITNSNVFDANVILNARKLRATIIVDLHTFGF